MERFGSALPKPCPPVEPVLNGKLSHRAGTPAKPENSAQKHRKGNLEKLLQHLSCHTFLRGKLRALKACASTHSAWSSLRVTANMSRATRPAAQFYQEDLVCLRTNPSRLGVVSRTHLGPPEEDEEESDYDEQTDLAPDEVEVSWMTNPPGPPQLLKAHEVRVVDRGFLPGDVVLHPSDPNMCGVVTAVKVDVDLCDMRTQAVTRDVDAQQLEFKYPFFSTGGILFKDTWCGRLHDISNCRVRVLFASGALCECQEADLEMNAHIEFGDEHNILSVDRVQPGLVVRVRKSFKDHVLRWMSDNQNIGSGVGIIVDIIVDQLDVDWGFDSSAVGGPNTDPPSPLISPAHVRSFQSAFEYTSFFLGNLVKFKSQGEDATCYKVVRTNTLLTVRWQDATIQTDIHSVDLRLPLVIDDTALWPGDIVWNKMGEVVQLEDSADIRVAVVQSVDVSRRLAVVRWFDAGWESLGVPETCSLYEVTSHPHFTMDLSDRVLIPANKDDPQYGWFGEIVGIELDGTRQVRTTEGNVETHRFDGLILLDPTDGDFGDDDEGSVDEMDEDAEWLTDEEAIVDDMDDVHMDDQSLVQPVRPSEHREGDSEAAVLARPSDAIASMPEAEVENGAQYEEESAEDVFEVLEKVDEATLHFREPTTMSQTLVRRITKEHRLFANLPKDIFVRTFSNRMDILFALVFGPSDTPYEYAPFLFEIQLPDDYPQSPPKVYFVNKSGGRMNPNLHEDGKVCLSLLNTWRGKDTESWNPTSSSILQFLVSVQGLVLNKEPYFLEPGFQKFTNTEDGSKNSKAYNERVFILSVKGTLAMLERPPAAFQEVLERYYVAHGEKLMDMVRAKLSDGHLSEGARVLLQPVVEKLEKKIEVFKKSSTDSSNA